ncbi:MAG TPA: hypothetical protein VEU47_10950 [Candidatus Cybelea sp.]|nr:hypothetical protein [Candidatus Cybelea sp.]
MIRKFLLAAALLVAASAPAWPQAGQFPSGTVQGNAGASAGQAKPSTVTAILDRALGSTRGASIERGASGWGLIGPGSTAGLPFVSNGTGADPSYQVLGIAGGGTGATTQQGALNAIMCTPTRSGDLAYWNGSNWVCIAGNNSGTQLLSENGSGVPSWATAGAGTVTSVTCSGLAITASGTCPETFGFENCSIAASVGSNLLTVALKDNAGSDPSVTSPCRIAFRNITASTGSWSLDSVTSALSINSNATGATLGSVNGTAFKFWVVGFDNAGTVVLALINCSTPTSIFQLNEGVVQSTTAISGSATSAGVFYTPNGTTLSSKAFKILGYIEYGSGLTTAGTYASGPTAIQSVGPGVPKPGHVVQSFYDTITGVSTTTNTYSHSDTAPVAANGGLVGSQALTPTMASNRVRVRGQITMSNSATGPYGFAYVTTSAPTTLATSANTFPGATGYVTIPVFYEGILGSTSSVTYSLYGSAGSGTTTFNGVGGSREFGGTANSFIEVQEIMD